jgi:hypothetical protein
MSLYLYHSDILEYPHISVMSSYFYLSDMLEYPYINVMSSDPYLSDILEYPHITVMSSYLYLSDTLSYLDLRADDGENPLSIVNRLPFEFALDYVHIWSNALWFGFRQGLHDFQDRERIIAVHVFLDQGIDVLLCYQL